MSVYDVCEVQVAGRVVWFVCNTKVKVPNPHWKLFFNGFILTGKRSTWFPDGGVTETSPGFNDLVINTTSHFCVHSFQTFFPLANFGLLYMVPSSLPVSTTCKVLYLTLIFYIITSLNDLHLDTNDIFLINSSFYLDVQHRAWQLAWWPNIPALVS